MGLHNFSSGCDCSLYDRSFCTYPNIGMGVHSEVGAEKEIAFTFDDGPDPCYTPELLDLLKEHGIKATFFVLGKKAKQYPELIERMHREGHQIGIHNYTHTPNWIHFPGPIDGSK